MPDTLTPQQQSDIDKANVARLREDVGALLSLIPQAARKVAPNKSDTVSAKGLETTSAMLKILSSENLMDIFNAILEKSEAIRDNPQNKTTILAAGQHWTGPQVISLMTDVNAVNRLFGRNK